MWSIEHHHFQWPWTTFYPDFKIRPYLTVSISETAKDTAIVTIRTVTYSTRSSSLPLLTVPNPSTVFARRAFNYTAPTTWNSLPADILTCDSESGFKPLLKTHLFNNCFNVAWLTHSQRLCSSAYGALQICLWYDKLRIGNRTKAFEW